MSEEARVRIHLCGRVRVDVDGRSLQGALGGQHGRNVFAFLALNRFREVPRTELVASVCESPQDEDELETALSTIEGDLGGMVERGVGVRLALPVDTWIDLEAAEEALYRAEGAVACSDWDRAYSAAHVALYIAERGFLPGCELPWAAQTRRQIQDIHVRALECSATASLALGGSLLPIGEKNARQAAELAPLRESAHRVLMEVLAARGNEAEAVRVYEELRGRLREELGTSPGQTIEAVVKRLLRDHEPTFAGGAETRTFMFTDIVSSTNLIELIGDEAWHDLVTWHDRTLRSLFEEHDGEEVDHAGDGFFVAFPNAASAVTCAVAIQRRLQDHRRSHGFAPPVRIGLHAAAAVYSGGTYRGKGVHQAARIGAVAGGGEIIASRATVDGAQGSVSVSTPRVVELKGIAEPVQIVTIAWS